MYLYARPSNFLQALNAALLIEVFLLEPYPEIVIGSVEPGTGICVVIDRIDRIVSTTVLIAANVKVKGGVPECRPYGSELLYIHCKMALIDIYYQIFVIFALIEDER